MSAAQRPVSGPFPIDVESIPAGVTLDVEKFVLTTVVDVLDKLLGDEFGERFDEVRDASPSDPHAVQRPADLLFESLAADLTAEVGTKMPVYGAQVLRLAERLRLLAQPRPVPAQREGSQGGAAA